MNINDYGTLPNTQNLPGIPARSVFGNKMTAFVFKYLCGIRITDTQTGLRAFPKEHIGLLLNTDGERFEYETNVLLEMHRNKFSFKEQRIKTVYIDNNSETHFNPFKDSIKIYAVIIKFMLSSGLSSIIDILVFTLINMLIPDAMDEKLRVFVATFGARLISSLGNFFTNRTRVFKCNDGLGGTMLRYYILCAVQTLCSYGLVALLSSFIPDGWRLLQSAIKIVVDVVLFFLSFRIQRDWVFHTNKQKENSDV